MYSGYGTKRAEVMATFLSFYYVNMMNLADREDDDRHLVPNCTC